MVIDCNVAAVTVSATTFEVIPACPAVTLLEPTPVPVARPLLPMVAAAVFEEVQVTEFVRVRAAIREGPGSRELVGKALCN